MTGRSRSSLLKKAIRELRAARLSFLRGFRVSQVTFLNGEEGVVGAHGGFLSGEEGLLRVCGGLPHGEERLLGPADRVPHC